MNLFTITPNSDPSNIRLTLICPRKEVKHRTNGTHVTMVIPIH